MRRHGWPSTLVYWSILLAYAFLISWFSSLGSNEIPSIFGAVWDKLLHAASFSLLTFLFLLAANQGFRHPPKPALMVTAVMVTVLYGLFDEWHQSTVDTRVASAADLLADGVGSLAALPLYAMLARVLEPRGDS